MRNKLQALSHHCSTHGKKWLQDVRRHKERVMLTTTRSKNEKELPERNAVTQT
jgi:hypothetical protein